MQTAERIDTIRLTSSYVAGWRRIAAPMVGGMITAPILSMLVLPAAYFLWHRRELRRSPPSRAA